MGEAKRSKYELDFNHSVKSRSRITFNALVLFSSRGELG